MAVTIKKLSDFDLQVNRVVQSITGPVKDVNGVLRDLPKDPFILQAVHPYTHETRRMSFISPTSGIATNLYLPKDMEFRVVSKVKEKQVKESYKEVRRQHINTSLIGQICNAVGSDPELFVEDGQGNILPAFKFLPGKDKPAKTAKGGGYNGGVQGGLPLYWDGFQAEFEVKADGCLGWVVDSIYCGLKATLEEARKVDPKAKLSTKTLIELPQEVIDQTEQKFLEFGCMPSFNAYGLSGNLMEGYRTPFRSAGGHIHFGLPEAYRTDEILLRMVKALDAILGVACVSLFQSFDSPIRRIYYGLPGEYRKPPHGLEYRVLSNAWMFHPTITNIVFDMARKVAFVGYQDLLSCWEAREKEVQEIILSCDVKKAQKLLMKNKPMFQSIIRSAYATDRSDELVFKIFMNGMESVIEDPNNIAKNWDLLEEGPTWMWHSDGINRNWVYSKNNIESGNKI